MNVCNGPNNSKMALDDVICIPDLHCMRKVPRDTEAPVHWSAARGKGCWRSGWSAGGFVPPAVCIARRIVFKESCFQSLGNKWDGGQLGEWFGKPSDPTRPARLCSPAMGRNAAARLWYVRALDSTSGLFLQTCRVQNPDIPRTGRGGLGQVETPAVLFAEETSDRFARPGFDDICPGRLFRSTNKRKPM